MPMQTIAMPSIGAARAALESLAGMGMRALATRSCGEGKPNLSFLVTARHQPADISRLLAALDRISGGILAA